MRIVEYDREKAVYYAKTWAFNRNPNYYDFSLLGGDCTNFLSQCLYFGSNQMNFTRNVGWYYKSINDRTPSWTGVNFFYDFIMGNKNKIGNGLGPFGELVDISDVEVGDFIQLGNSEKGFYHGVIVTSFDEKTPLTSSHSFDSFNRNIFSYSFEFFRCIKILGVRKT